MRLILAAVLVTIGVGSAIDLYFDEVYTVISGGTHSTSAMKDSTEHEQFHGGDEPDVPKATAKATVPPKGKKNGHA